MSKIDRINHCIAEAKPLREQLNLLAIEFAQLHNEPTGSDEADELMHVILDGEEYQHAMERILAIKKHRSL